VSRTHRLALTVALAVIAPAIPLSGSSVAYAEAAAAESPIDVGTELMATSDVTLHKAEIAKGSRVSVTKITRHGEEVDAVNVALADGHVVKVTMAQVHTFFRVVAD
jgi:prepilin-type processing-associated H-X9-DG protein